MSCARTLSLVASLALLGLLPGADALAEPAAEPLAVIAPAAQLSGLQARRGAALIRRALGLAVRPFTGVAVVRLPTSGLGVDVRIEPSFALLSGPTAFSQALSGRLTYHF